jgi:hypothetical protein
VNEVQAMRWYTIPLLLALVAGVWITIGPVVEPKDNTYALVKEVVVGLVITLSALVILLSDLRSKQGSPAARGGRATCARRAMSRPLPRRLPIRRQGVFLTTQRRALGPFEMITTAVAVGVSTALYIRDGHPYLARGVVGDLAGLGFLTVVLATRHRRLRHEALTCLAAIGVVLAADPQWLLRVPSAAWWLAVAAGLAGYLAARRHLL